MCISPILVNDPKNEGEKIKVNCGKCIICRRKKCREWSLKLFHEGQYHKKMTMLTLTFRPRFLLKPEWKTLQKIHTRRKYDGTTEKTTEKYQTIIGPHYIKDVKKTGWLVTLFMKKLRKELAKKNIFISYYAVGEHGTQKTRRAHWHIIIFGIDKDDLGAVNIGVSKKNKEIYFSKLIEDLWSYKKINIGMHTISDVTQATIKYVANYTMKKMYNNEVEKEYPTIMRCSSHNKIGKKWARRYHKELRKEYLEDNDGMKYAIPQSYYREMTRFGETFENKSMNLTAEYIEINKMNQLCRLLKKGLLKDEEMQKKAKRLNYYYSKQERDVF